MTLYEVKENVLRFDIAMDDLLLMDVVKSFADLSDNGTCFCIFHAIVLPQELEKLASSTVFDQQIDVFLILKVAIERSNISVI
jgi:hypothetical protein